MAQIEWTECIFIVCIGDFFVILALTMSVKGVFKITVYGDIMIKPHRHHHSLFTFSARYKPPHSYPRYTVLSRLLPTPYDLS